MRKLTVDDLFLGLKDIVTKRRLDLELSAVGKMYAPQLDSRVVLLEDVTERKTTRANATELGYADDGHDGFGQGIWCYTEAVLITPSVSETSRNAALRVREAFIPVRSILSDSYAEEAARAKKNRAKVAELENELKSLPVPDGKTLYDWVIGFLDAGDLLDKLLSERSTVEAAAASGTATTLLRATTIGILRRFRESLRDEVAANPALPRDLEARVFAYIDELAARRAKNEKKPENT